MLRLFACSTHYPLLFGSTPNSQTCKRDECGQSIVETVVCMLILLTVLFGIFQASLAVYSYHFIAEAAREGTRYAVVRGSACTGFGSACPATAAQIQSYVTGLGFPGIDTRPAAMTVTVNCGPVGSTPAGACSAGNNDPGHLVLVAITYRFPFAIPFVPCPPANPNCTITMKSSSQMVISQ